LGNSISRKYSDFAGGVEMQQPTQEQASYRPNPILRRFQENPAWQGIGLISPTFLYLLLFMIMPMLLVVILSMLTRGPYGDVVYRLNWLNYSRLIDTLYLRILWFSLWTAGLTTFFSVLIGYPLAYYIARAPRKQRSLLLFLILVPFWTNFIIRIYAWIMILRTEGLLNTLLINLGVIKVPLEILYTPTAVLIGMVYEFLPFMVLPLYTSLEKIENAQLEAAADLGARPWRVFLRVTFPLSVPGMIAGSILVFIPAMGMFVVPDLMGGAKTILVGNLIRNQFLVARDWPFGASASMLLLLLTLAVTLFYTRKAGFGEELLV
jgi:spermidine/putrescine transport system permease protein